MIRICVADNSYKAIFFFLFITQIILNVFYSGQINLNKCCKIFFFFRNDFSFSYKVALQKTIESLFKSIQFNVDSVQ